MRISLQLFVIAVVAACTVRPEPQARQQGSGQQQRLTLARALSLSPEILCLDEFSIAIDPVTTMRIEDVLKKLRTEMTIVIVTHNMAQARRVSDECIFMSFVIHI